jgi:hypothetical protein
LTLCFFPDVAAGAFAGSLASTGLRSHILLMRGAARRRIQQDGLGEPAV